MTLVLLGLSWVAGLVPLAAWDSPWWLGAGWVAAGAGILLPRSWSRRNGTMAVACVALALAAGWRLSGALEQENPGWVALVGEEVEIAGKVVSEPDQNRITAGYVIAVETIDGRPAGGGRVLVQVHQYDEYLPGDRLVLRGELEAPPVFDTFDYRAYLQRQDIFGTMFRPQVRDVREGGGSVGRWLTARRTGFDEALQRSLPEPEASLAAGVAFGRDDGLSREVLEEYNRSGLRHLVAVSGSNVSLVAAMTYFLAVPLISRRWASIPAAATIAMYLAAAGLSGSVLRAGIMAGVFLVGTVVGRPQSGLPALFAAVMGMTAVTPELAVDTGFQLSATATAGLLTLAPWIARGLMAGTSRIPWVGVPRTVCQVAALTLAATAATAPVMWHTFGELSVVSPLANLLVEPVFPLAFWASLATAGLGLISEDAAAVAGVAGWYPLAFIGSCASFFGSLSWATIPAPAQSVELALGAYIPMGAAALLAYRFPARSSPEPRPVEARRERSRRLVLAGSVGAVCLAAVPVSFGMGGRDGLTIEFLDVGQGDAALITTPNGKQVLIDGGPSGIEVARELGAVMPHWDRSLDAVVLSHPQEDHVAGLPEVFERYRVATVYDSGFDNETRSYALFASQTEAGYRQMAAGDAFAVDGVRFEVLWPPMGFVTDELNEASLVVLVTFDGVGVLFAGDAEGAALAALEGVRANVLKVPHHGSKTTPPAFLQSVGAQVAVVSVGAENPFGHPHPDVLAALAESRVYRTDEDGRITVRLQAGKVRVSTER